jgi:hypothetical protein
VTCAQCSGILPRFPERVDKDGAIVAVCSWKCRVLVRAANGEAEAIAFAKYYGWEMKTAGAAGTDAGPCTANQR